MSHSPTRKSLKSGSESETEVDRISNVPDNVTDQILSCLPIKEAAKTSVLSTKWRYKWEAVPCLKLTDLLFPPPKNDQGVAVIDKLVKNIDRLLFLHSGPLCNFELSYPTLSIPADEIDKWIRHVLRHSLKGFSFKISNLKDYRIPSIVFSCQNLTSLSLSKCSLTLPSALKGLKNLKSLLLVDVTVSQDMLECLVSSSIALEVLSLRQMNGLSLLNIKAPNLQSFAVSGDKFVDIRLNGVSHLHTFSMSIYDSFVEGIQNGYHGNFGNFVTLLVDRPQITKLCIQSSSIEYLARGNIPRELPVHCVHLEILSVSVDLCIYDETSALLCLLRSAPNLQTLQLNLYGFQDTSSKIWEAEPWNCTFTHLRRIIIETFAFESPKTGMDFIKFMLSTTPVLETMVFSLERVPDEKKLDVVKQLCCFKRLSPMAEFVCQ